MGLHFGHLYHRMRGIAFVRLSPHELKAMGGILSKGVPNVFRRMGESFFFVVPPFATGYLVYDWVESTHHKMMRKNPADFENDK